MSSGWDKFNNIFNIVGDVVPVFVDWLKVIFDTSDVEFESIQKVWPAPTRSKLARLRAEAKIRAAFPVEEVHE